MELKDVSRIWIALFLVLTACGDDGDDSKTDKHKANKLRYAAYEEGVGQEDGQRLFKLTDSLGVPVSGARIFVGDMQLQSDANGTFTAPDVWRTTLPVTIEATGFVRTTFTELAPVGKTLKLQEQDGKERLTISGTATDFGVLRSDGKIHFALILPHLTKRNLTQFDMSLILSPDVDEISVIGKKLQLPSNLALPEQRASFIFPITLSKPKFRTIARQTGLSTYVAAHGQFPLMSVVSEIRAGKSIFQVINSFEFLTAGSRDVLVDGTGAIQDISVNTEVFNSTMAVQAPVLKADQIMVAMALNEQAGKLYPTDLKRVVSNGKQNLKTSKDEKSKYVLSMLKKEDPTNSVEFKQLSFALQKFSGEILAPTFLDLIDPPVLRDGVLTLSPPQVVPDIQTLGTYIVLVEAEALGTDSVRTEARTRLWEVYAPDWLHSFTLPQVGIVKNPERTYRWEVMYLGGQGGGTSENLFDNVTHITRHVIQL